MLSHIIFIPVASILSFLIFKYSNFGVLCKKNINCDISSSPKIQSK